MKENDDLSSTEANNKSVTIFGHHFRDLNIANMNKKDFFICFNKHDTQWADWIAWQLEAADYHVLIQSWDWGPGNNFILEMQKATELCERTILVMSPYFLNSTYTQPEWAQAFVKDPTGEMRLLIPVRVANCELKGFFKPIVYIDFLESPPSDKNERREYLITKLLEGVDPKRKKPKVEPVLPDLEFAPSSIDGEIEAIDLSDDKAFVKKNDQRSESNTDSLPDDKFHGKQRSELLNFYALDWLQNGPPVAILQGFPGCGKSQLSLAIAAKASRSLQPIEPQISAQDPSLDILIELAKTLDSEGISDLMEELGKETDSDPFSSLLKVLRRDEILIIIDEFQRLFSDRNTLPPVGWQHLVEALSNSNRPAGRLLLISNRAVKAARWCENCVSRELKGLTDAEATIYLSELRAGPTNLNNPLSGFPVYPGHDTPQQNGDPHEQTYTP